MKNELSGAVRLLRLALGQTQEQFSREMGTTVRTIGRWEVGKNPGGNALVQMKRLATTAGREDLRAAFHAAITHAGLAWDTSDLALDLEARDDDERLTLAAVLSVWRNAEYATLRAKIRAGLREPARRCIEILEEHRLTKRIKTDATRLLDAGIEVAAVAAALKVPRADIQRLALLLRMRRTLESLKEKSK